MKKKIFIGIAMSLFAVATVFNLSISKQSKAGDVSLEAIKVMAQAQAEIIINAPWEKVCHPSKIKCTWRAISSRKSCRFDSECW